HVGLLDVRGQLQALAGGQHVGHARRVVLVHLAAVGLDEELAAAARRAGRGGDGRGVLEDGQFGHLVFRGAVARHDGRPVARAAVGGRVLPSGAWRAVARRIRDGSGRAGRKCRALRPPGPRRVRFPNRAPFNNQALGRRTSRVDTARMKGGWGLIAVAGLALATLAAPAWAGTIYRCDTADGERSYVSKRVKGATCVAV